MIFAFTLPVTSKEQTCTLYLGHNPPTENHWSAFHPEQTDFINYKDFILLPRWEITLWQQVKRSLLKPGESFSTFCLGESTKCQITLIVRHCASTDTCFCLACLLTSLKASRSSFTPIMPAVSAKSFGAINSTKSSKSTLPPTETKRKWKQITNR